LRLQLLAN